MIISQNLAPSGGLSVSDVSLNYNTSRGILPTLKSIDFRVGKGEFVSVLGPSGCGKSSLLKLVSGLLPPSGGSIDLLGKPVQGPCPEVGMVFQQATLLPWRTVLENVLMPIDAMGRNVKDYTDRAIGLLKMVGLEQFRAHYPKELSGGMQQRVGIARALIHDPSVLLMDEPFAALDALTRERMMVELQTLWHETNKSVLFITHSIPEAVFLSDRVIVMSQRPATIIEEIDISLERPRAIETMGDPEFVAVCNKLRRMFDNMHVGDVLS